MARERDYPAEYRARTAKLATRGETVYQRRDRAAKSLGYRSLSQRTKALRTGKDLRPADIARRAVSAADRRQVIPTPAGTVVRSTPSGKGLHVVESRIAKAPRNAKVTLVVTVQMADGSLRDVTIFGRGGWSAGKLADAFRAAGGIDEYVDDQIADGQGISGGGFGISSVVSMSVFIS
jgi:hypothetical protein